MPASLICNVCGCSRFKDFNGRTNAMCVECFSVERTRCMQLVLFGRRMVKPGARIFHLAPELGIARNIRAVPGTTHEAYDFDPTRYPAEIRVRKFDLTKDVEPLPSNTYDLVIHSHVMEHIACDVTSVLFHLHRSLKKDGSHVFCIPILHGHYAEDLSPLSEAEMEERFGQKDHVRRFGRADLQNTIGKVFRLPPAYDLEGEFGAEVLATANIPASAWKGFTAHTIFTIPKPDIRLQS